MPHDAPPADIDVVLPLLAQIAKPSACPLVLIEEAFDVDQGATRRVVVGVISQRAARWHNLAHAASPANRAFGSCSKAQWRRV